MIAKISTVLGTSENEFWEKLIQPKSLQFVSAPILNFQSLQDEELEVEWEIGKPYELKLYLLNFLPLGHHRITLATIDRETNTIESNESGLLAPVWNHTIRFNQIEENQIHYTDEVEIQAGLLTLFIWAFAHIFYRHRQRRWKKLLEQKING
jgi:hypothetical protein